MTSSSRGTSGAAAAERLRLPGLVPEQLVRDGAVREGRLAAEQEIEAASQAVDVGPHVRGLTGHGLLRCDVETDGACREWPDHCAASSDCLPRPGPGVQAQVEQFDGAVAVEQNIGRLDVAMDPPSSWACRGRPRAA